ncbi:reverse transcriptase domain-containing protein [Tanacetum coccineum]|uniref:Reverse transcriptase domain-containing protein n=1 Tax=Tanacetum coccineum TaxID=301880 RepID=A0ABQ4YHG2_9ASTR
MGRDSLPALVLEAMAKGIDITGPFLEGPGKVKFLIVAIDYFTKWIEAKVVATISGTQVKNFVWDNIVCRFEPSVGKDSLGQRKQFMRRRYSQDWSEAFTFRPRYFVYRSNDVSHAKLEKAWSKVGRTLRGNGITGRWSIQAKIYGRDSHPTDVEHHQSQKVLSLSHGSCMDELALQ